MRVDESRPAFPCPSDWTQYGMTLRDWFAGLAMQALISRNLPGTQTSTDIAYGFADEMLTSRLKKGELLV